VFPKKQRIPKSYFPLLSKAKNRHSPLFSVSFLEGVTNKFAVVVSRKCSKEAVVRNKNKRRVRHALKKLTFSQKGHYAVFVKKDLSKVEFPTVEQELKHLISTL
jgi:ribonuclease P protein component